MAQILDNVITLVIWAIVIRALLSFVPNLANHPAVRFLYDVTDPILKPFQRFQIGGGGFAVDFSPVIAIIVLNILRSVLMRLLIG